MEKDNEEIAVGGQCELLNLPRSPYYYSQRAMMTLILS